MGPNQARKRGFGCLITAFQLHAATAVAHVRGPCSKDKILIRPRQCCAGAGPARVHLQGRCLGARERQVQGGRRAVCVVLDQRHQGGCAVSSPCCCCRLLASLQALHMRPRQELNPLQLWVAGRGSGEPAVRQPAPAAAATQQPGSSQARPSPVRVRWCPRRWCHGGRAFFLPAGLAFALAACGAPLPRLPCKGSSCGPASDCSTSVPSTCWRLWESSYSLQDCSVRPCPRGHAQLGTTWHELARALLQTPLFCSSDAACSHASAMAAS